MTLRETIQAELAKAQADVASLEAKLASSWLSRWADEEIADLKAIWALITPHLL